jgi:hypothetical protein
LNFVRLILKRFVGAYTQGVHDAKFTSWLLYGGQGYSGNFHYVLFDREWLKSILIEHGLRETHYKDDGNNFIMKVKHNG